MATQIPEFDFSQYNPQDVWNFPPQRLVRYGAEAYQVVTAARSRWMKRFPYPDLRFVYWYELGAQAHALLVAAMHLRSHGDDVAWWELQPEFNHSFDKRLIAHNNLEVRQNLQLGFVQHVVRQTDLAMRQIADALSGEAETNKKPLSTIWKTVLQASALDNGSPLLHLLLIYRDSLSQHGRFCPVDGQDLHLRHAGRSFSFQAHHELDLQANGFIDHWDFFLFLLRELVGTLEQVFESVAVTGIRHLKVPYLDA